MAITARYLFDDAGRPQRLGVLTINGVDFTGPLPPNDGPLLAIYNAWTAEGDNYVPAPIPVPQSATKLGLKRAMEEIGRWGEVRAMIEADPAVAEEWQLAIEIRRDDPMFTAFIVSGQFTSGWVYVLGPIVGGVLAALLHDRFVSDADAPGSYDLE